MLYWRHILTLAPLVTACSDDGDGRFNARIAEYRQRSFLQERSQEGATLPPVEEFRALEWGDLNFIHVTDTHGWESGHPNQAQFSADWGDLVSFNEHLQAEADRRGVDFLVVETGDRHDGTGLSDATPADGALSQLVFAQANFDVLSMGNHELYKKKDALQEYNVLRPHFGDRYLASNVDLFIDGEWVPAGNRYRVFETKNRGYRVLALGFLYDFTGNDNGTRVTPAAQAVNQTWFTEVVSRNDFDIILLTGHIPVRGFKELNTIVDAIRAHQPNIPIQGFGGHTHVRDYHVFDSNAAALESGRYLETIGWASVTFGGESTFKDSVKKAGNKTNTFHRRYLDFNPLNFAFHTNTSVNATADEKPFQTPKGLAISQQIAGYRDQLKLDNELAYVPQNYLLERAPYPSNSSLLTLSENGVFQKLQGNVSRNDKPRYIMANSGTFRYDLFAGKYTEDTKFIVSPFSDFWYYLPDVPIDAADEVLSQLNKGKYLRRSLDEDRLLDHINNSSRTTSDPIPTLSAATSLYLPPAAPTSADNKLYNGYVTSDDLDKNGDDTPHLKYKTYDMPNVICAKQSVDKDTEKVDLVVLDFIVESVTPILKKSNVSNTEFEVYGGKLIRDLIEDYFKD